jgi:hypothetical protein
MFLIPEKKHSNLTIVLTRQQYHKENIQSLLVFSIIIKILNSIRIDEEFMHKNLSYQAS